MEISFLENSEYEITSGYDLRNETERPSVEWLKAPAVRSRVVRERDGYAVNVGNGMIVKVATLAEVELIIGDGSIPNG
jgi:hypothetical protein